MNIPNDKFIDIITLGHSQVDFYSEQIGSSLQDSLSFKKRVGGLAAILSIGCARLKMRTAFISVVGKDPLGEFLIETLQAEKVDISQLKIEPTQQTALTMGTHPFQMHYKQMQYNTLCANFSQSMEEINPAFIAKAKALLVVSSNFQNENTLLASKKAMTSARESHVKVILVLDQPPSDVQSLQAILPFCDMVFGTAEQLEVFNHIAEFKADKAIIIPELQGFEAYVAGYLRAWTLGDKKDASEKMAKACQLLGKSQSSQLGLPSAELLTLFLSEQQHVVSQTLSSPYFSHVHYGSTHYKRTLPIYGFSFPEGAPWRKLKENFQVDDAIIQKAKKLITQGIIQASEINPGVGLIVDDSLSSEELQTLSKDQWLARSLEVPGEIPLQFQGDPDITHTLLQWPKNHIAKVSMVYHPDDRYNVRNQQEATLRLLYKACRTTGHELLIDIAPPTNSLITASTMAHIMHRFYEIGIYPDWWQVPAPRDQRSWESMQRIIEANDPFCQGIIVLAPLATFEQLPLIFQSAAKQSHCKGFIVGRAIFQSLIEKWLSKKLDDSVLIDQVARNLQKAIQLWMEAKEVKTSATLSY